MHSSSVNRGGARNSLPHGAGISIFRDYFPPYFSLPHLSSLPSVSCPTSPTLQFVQPLLSVASKVKYDATDILYKKIKDLTLLQAPIELNVCIYYKYFIL